MKDDADEIKAALREVMVWINNWSPEFIWDAEWPELEAHVFTLLED